jgi:hypothetical protein
MSRIDNEPLGGQTTNYVPFRAIRGYDSGGRAGTFVFPALLAFEWSARADVCGIGYADAATDARGLDRTDSGFPAAHDVAATTYPIP